MALTLTLENFSDRDSALMPESLILHSRISRPSTQQKKIFRGEIVEAAVP